MIKLSQYKNAIIGVIGAGVTGKSVIKALHQAGAKTIYIWEDNPEVSLESLNINSREVLLTKETAYWRQCEIIVPSPGVIAEGQFIHPAVKVAKSSGAQIISDIDLFYNEHKTKRYIGVTGTNGKSTVTSLITSILNNSGGLYQAGGNLGIPALQLDENMQGYVLELSSFQLEITNSLRLDIAVILGITKDHLDRYHDFDTYIAAKSRIINLLKPGGTLVINLDNSACMKLYEQVQQKHSEFINSLNIIPIYISENSGAGISVYYKSNTDNSNSLLLGDSVSGPEQTHYFNESKFKLIYNPENLAASYAVCSRLGVDFEKFHTAISDFSGLKHRMQIIGEACGITFINDSKATNLNAACQALSKYYNIFWLAGGVLKETELDLIKHYSDHINRAYFFGRDKSYLKSSLEDSLKCEEVENLQEAFKISLTEAKKQSESYNIKTYILLSPACASYDQFKNFAARGEEFINLCKNFITYNSGKFL